MSVIYDRLADEQGDDTVAGKGRGRGSAGALRERRMAIAERVVKNGSASVDDLVELTGVSAMTVYRDIEALEEMEFELLTERRRHHPRGAAGGELGQTGRNLLVDADGTATELEPKTGGHLGPGQRLRIETPGGGGFGEPR